MFLAELESESGDGSDKVDLGVGGAGLWIVGGVWKRVERGGSQQPVALCWSARGSLARVSVIGEAQRSCVQRATSESGDGGGVHEVVKGGGVGAGGGRQWVV